MRKRSRLELLKILENHAARTAVGNANLVKTIKLFTKKNQATICCMLGRRVAVNALVLAQW